MWELSSRQSSIKKQHCTGACRAFGLDFIYSDAEQMPKLFGQRGRGRKGSYSPPLHTDLMTRLSFIPSLRCIRAISWLVTHVAKQ